MNIFQGLYLAGVIIAEVIRFPHRMRNKRERRQHQLGENRISALEITVDLLSWSAMEVLPFIYVFADWPARLDYSLPPWAAWLGVPIFALGLWLIWRSHRDLGLNWSPTLELQKDHHLVTQGVYATLRHPIYAGMWLWGIAQALLLHNWLAGLSGLVTFALVYFTRVPKEERMMLDSFGEQYREYKARTGGVIPRIKENK